MKQPKYLIFMGMGFELIGVILSCAWIGQWLDQQYQLKGIGLLSLTMLGLVGWFYHLIILVQRIQRIEDREK